VAERRCDQPRATVVTIHGGLDRGASFTRLSRRLDEVDCVAYDRRGYQRSRSRGPGSLDQHVDDLAEVVTWGAAAAPLVLVGHSFGGLVAMTYASRGHHVDLVVSYESPLPWILERSSPTPPPGDHPGLEAERFFRRVVSDDAWEHLSAAEQESRRGDGPALQADLRSMTDPVAPFDLSELTVPVRYLFGDQRAASYYRALAQRLSRANHHITAREISGAGHGAHLSHPEHLAREILRALDELTASR
jgi:pimeloyl-ACP methyl ester carboxylesterase